MSARLLISAAHKSSGKTTVSVGLCAALAAAGEVVQPFKKGPDYIDPMWLGRAAGRPCYNLDPHLMDHADLRALFDRKAQGASLCVVEGNKGLYDGLDLDGSNSNAALAHLLGLPVLLVIDTRGMTRGVAPLLLGYQAFDRRLHLAGVVLSRVGGSRHEAKMRAVIEHYTDLRVVGAVAEEPALALPERHLGLQPCAERDQTLEDIARIGRRVAEQVDLAAVRAIARQAVPSAPLRATSEPTSPGTAAPERLHRATPVVAPVRIAIARDPAFAFYYPDDLEAFERAGAELVPFNTLHDTDLPPGVDGLFIGGGFPEQLMGELEANVALRHALRQRIETGLPTYAECGGLMYLARSIRWQERSAEMVGVIPADAVMRPRPVGRGYVQLAATPEHPWVQAGSLSADHALWAHEFHHSQLVGLPEVLPPGMAYAWTVQRGHGIDGRHDGLVMHRLLASYAHLRSVTGSRWVEQFVASVRAPARPAASPQVLPASPPPSGRFQLPLAA